MSSFLVDTMRLKTKSRYPALHLVCHHGVFSTIGDLIVYIPNFNAEFILDIYDFLKIKKIYISSSPFTANILMQQLKEALISP